jgi:hypothetical protein
MAGRNDSRNGGQRDECSGTVHVFALEVNVRSAEARRVPPRGLVEEQSSKLALLRMLPAMPHSQQFNRQDTQ